MTIDIRDKPLRVHLSVGLQGVEALGLRTGDVKQDIVTAGILGQLGDMALRHDRRFISYSRRKQWWIGPKADMLRNCGFTLQRVVRAVDALERRGLVEHHKARACQGGSGFQSRLRASRHAFGSSEALWVEAVGPTLILRDADKQIMPLPDVDMVRRHQRQLDDMNGMLDGIDIGGPHMRPGGLCDTGRGPLLRVGPIILRRIFCRGSLTLGGRYYATFQNLPKDIRATLTIDGEAVASHDHACLHPRLIYAQAGHVLPDDFDAYKPIVEAGHGEAWTRDLVKRAFNTLVNADTPTAARSRNAFELADHHGDNVLVAAAEAGPKPARHAAWHTIGQRYGNEAARLIAMIHAFHAPIARYFASGIGVRLQFVDSQMAAAVTKRLARQGIRSLPEHDEHYAAAKYESRLREAMHDTLQNTLAKLASKVTAPVAGVLTRKTAHYCGTQAPSGPHSGRSLSCPVPALEGSCVAVRAASTLQAVVPGGRLLSSDVPADEKKGGAQNSPILQRVPVNDLALGGLLPINGAAEALAGFRGGILPAPLRAAAKHGLRARGLTQDRAARLLGLSRPQLTNTLVGRFGLGRAPAARLVALLGA